MTALQRTREERMSLMPVVFTDVSHLWSAAGCGAPTRPA